MGSEFTFYDYVDERGKNVIKQWLMERGKKARIKINTRLNYLETTPLPWPTESAKQLTGPCDGLIEIRAKAGNVQLRPLGFFGPEPKQVTLVLGAIEKNNQLRPRNACTIALRRKQQVHENPTRYLREHDYG